MDSLRNYTAKTFNKNSVNANLKQLNNVESDKRDADFYFQRGKMHFQLANLNEAMEDFDAALTQKHSTFRPLFFKARTLERLYRFDEAIELFATLAALSGTKEMDIFYALAKRKKAMHQQK